MLCLNLILFSSLTAPSSSPRDFVGNVTSPTTCFFTWKPPPPEDQNGVIISYQLNITELESTAAVQYTTTNTYITISGLLPYKRYSCIIAATTSVGIGPYSTVITIMTSEAGMCLFVRGYEYCVMPAMFVFSCSPKQCSHDYSCLYC